jgi:hypothetical protein
MRDPLGLRPVISEPFHVKHRQWLIAWGVTLGIVILVALSNLSSSGDSAPQNEEETSSDRAPYAEVACEDFTREAGIRTDDGETSNITPNGAIGDIYTVQMYDDDVRVGTCVVQATGAEEWTLVKISGP